MTTFNGDSLQLKKTFNWNILQWKTILDELSYQVLQFKSNKWGTIMIKMGPYIEKLKWANLTSDPANLIAKNTCCPEFFKNLIQAALDRRRASPGSWALTMSEPPTPTRIQSHGATKNQGSKPILKAVEQSVMSH